MTCIDGYLQRRSPVGLSGSVWRTGAAALSMLGLVVAVVAVLLVVAPSASAASKSLQSFIGGGLGGGGGQFNNPRDVAVYEGIDADPATDKIFVVEAQGGNMRVDRLDANGNFELMWGKDVDAANPSTGYEICTVATDCQAPAAAGTGALRGEFDDPMGLAVDQQNGWVYVFDRDNRRVQKFDLDGNFLLMFGKGVNATDASDVCTAADVAAGDVCQAGATGAGAAQIASTSLSTVRGLGVSPAGGNVFVSDPTNRRVLEYQPDGSFVRGWGFGVDTGAAQFQICTTASTCQAGNAAGLANGQFSNNSPLGLAIDSEGVVYATDAASGSSAQRILRFDSDLAPTAPGPPFPDASGALLSAINPTGAGGPLLATTTATNGLEIDADSDGAGPDQETLLALRDPNTPTTANTVVQELDIPTNDDEAPTDPITQTDVHSFAPAAASGLGVNSTTGLIYLPVSLTALQFSGCGCGPTSGLTVLAEAVAVSPELEPPANPTAGSVQLRATISPVPAVRYRFQISVDGENWQDAAPDAYAGGADSTEVTQTVTGLQPNTSYRVRLVLTRYTNLTAAQQVMSNEGLVLTDAAPPEVTTLGSANRTADSVELRAQVDPNGSATTYRFEYGPEGGSFDTHVPVPNASAGSGNTADLVRLTVTGLVRDSAYHYRVVATNASGTTIGSPVSFRTQPTTAGQPGLGERVHELVSPADKVGGSGVGLYGGGVVGAAGGAGVAAHDGDRYASSGSVGAVLLDGAMAYATDWAFADRTPNGWVSHSPVTHAASNRQTFRFLLMEMASKDLSTVVWTSNDNLLRPFPELASWPGINAEFMGDWSGRWEVFAPTALDQLHPSWTDAAAGVSSISESVVSANGSRVAATTNLGTGSPARSSTGGMAGDGDPADPAWPDLVAGRAAYLKEVSRGLADRLVDNPGAYANLGVCVDGTLLPEQNALGKLEDQPCLAPLPGRDARLLSDRGAALQSRAQPFRGENGPVDNVVSRDGSRVFVMSPDPIAAGVPAAGCTGTGSATLCPTQIYVRQRNTDGSVSTRWISHAVDGLLGDQDAALTGSVRFAGASADGDKVFFQTTSPLTADDPNGAGGPAPPGGVTTGTASNSSWDLYMYDLPNGPDGDPATPDADPAGGSLTRVSAGPSGTGDCNVVNKATHGALRFVSRDGGQAYFTCAAALPEVPLVENGTITTPGGEATTTDSVNLYAASTKADGPEWRFVARLPHGTGTLGQPHDLCATALNGEASILRAVDSSSTIGFHGTGGSCVRGTSDGAFMTFWTMGRLTPDDPDSASLDAYAYDFATDDLTRITAVQGGVGGSYPCNLASLSPPADPFVECYGDDGFSDGAISLLGVATDPLVRGDRLVFFQSRSRLVAEDADANYDVYQWRNGELSLLSDGRSAGGNGPGELGGSFYKGNDATGRNVYVATNDVMSWQDVDGVLDVYTARVGGGIPRPAPPVVCAVLVGGCHGGGGSQAVQPEVVSGRAGGGGDVVARGRAVLSVAGLSAKARRRAARSGVVRLRVRSNRVGRIVAVAKGRIARRTRRLGRGAVRLARPGAATLRVKLNRRARRALDVSRPLRLRIVVSAPGARKRTVQLVLRGTAG